MIFTSAQQLAKSFNVWYRKKRVHMSFHVCCFFSESIYPKPKSKLSQLVYGVASEWLCKDRVCNLKVRKLKTSIKKHNMRMDIELNIYYLTENIQKSV